jgi:beta-galactosidase
MKDITNMSASSNNLYKMGTAYYPDYVPSQSYDLDGVTGEEVSPEIRISQDIARMKKIGISEIRVGEFSWSSVEPEEGRFTPELFLYALDKAKDANIDVIFCTPTATPPKWLIDKHPDILPELANGQKIKFGSRRHYDPCNETYLSHTVRITEYFVKTFGSHPAVKMWQIDNELGHHGSSSLHTTSAVEAFRSYLKEKYSTIEELNKRWFTCFWSQGYTSFDQIDVPRENWTDPNPHTSFDHKRFCTKVYRDYQKVQYDIIKKNCPETVITHNLISNFYELCPWEMTEDLDQVGFDHYQDYDYPTPLRSASNFSLLGSLARENTIRKFKILEQQPIQVNWQKINRRFPFDWLMLWAGQSALFGADTMDYFSWQKFYGGSEQFHDGVMPHDVRNKCSNQEKLIMATNNLFQDLENNLSWNKIPDIKKDVLVIHNTESLWTHRITSQSEYYDTTFQLDEISECLTRSGLGFNYKNTIPSLDLLNEYRLVILPGYAFSLSAEEKDNLKTFMKGGGTVLSYPRSLMKTKDNHMSPVPLSFLEEQGFYFEEYGAMGPEEEELIDTNSEIRLSSHRWAEKIVVSDDSSIETLATFKTGLYEGSPAVLKFPYQKGSHIHLAFCPKDQVSFSKFLQDTVPSSSILKCAPTGIQIIPLETGDVGIINFSNESKRIETHFEKVIPYTYTLDKSLSLESSSGQIIKGTTLNAPGRSFSIISPQ